MQTARGLLKCIIHYIVVFKLIYVYIYGMSRDHFFVIKGFKVWTILTSATKTIKAVFPVAQTPVKLFKLKLYVRVLFISAAPPRSGQLVDLWMAPPPLPECLARGQRAKVTLSSWVRQECSLSGGSGPVAARAGRRPSSAGTLSRCHAAGQGRRVRHSTG